MREHQSLDSLVARKAVEFADQIKAAAAMADKEEEIRIEAEKQLAFIQKEAGIKLEGRHEFTVASGRIDSVYDRVIIEYKNPKSPGDRIGPRADSPGTKKVVEQIKRRFYDMRSQFHQPLNTLFGVGLDGNYFVFIRFRDDKWQIQDPVEVNKYSSERFLWALFNLGQKGKPFSAEYLAGDFGSEGGNTIARVGIHTLYEAITSTKHPKALTFFNQWKILFGEVCGYDVDNPTEKIKKLAKFYDVPIKDIKPAELLFAVHSYYAIFMKLLASEIVTFFRKLPTALQRLIQAPTSTKLRREMEELEAGSIFRHLNITNFLEGDLFAWYTSVWSEPVEKLVRDMAIRLDDYNPGTLSEDPATSRDLLKKLYQQLFPKSVRHDLGEYYTPDWLAEHVLNELGYEGDPDKRLLDPACGSGTFLVMAISRVRNWYDQNREKCAFGEDDLCRKVLTNIVGFDLNPLAVMAARTNYLIAIHELTSYVESIEIPIYLCDSILTPSEYGMHEQQEMFGKPMELPTSAKPTPFFIPNEVVGDGAALARYVGLLETCAPATSGYSVEEFLDRCREGGISTVSLDDHCQLFNDLRQLDQDRKNGIWARIIKNAFAPLFRGRFDFIAGNPPWINWDNLPGTYRDQTKPLWVRNGLFSLTGTAGRLGGGKKDISMLFVYEGVRNYLCANGRLGFVITQSLFKTEGAADGFRKFVIPPTNGVCAEPFCVIGVDDLSALKVFEGAANRTAAMFVQRGTETKHPVDYRFWRAKESATIPQDYPLDQVLAITERFSLSAVPVYPDSLNAPWLTVCKSVLSEVLSVVGRADYSAQAGATTCGADGVFLIRPIREPMGDSILVENIHDAGKRSIPLKQGKVLCNYLWPVLRGKDIGRWQTRPECLVLMLQDPENRVGRNPTEIKKHPGTWKFIIGFEEQLRTRRSSMLPKFPFYSIYGVNRDTFSPFKVLWGRVGNTVAAAVAGPVDSLVGAKPALPFEAMMIPFDYDDEAHFVCGCLNSTPAQLVVVGSIVLHPDTHVLRRVAIPKFDRQNASHREIAALSVACHATIAAKKPDDLRELETKLDEMCMSLWGINAGATESMRACLRQLSRKRRSRSKI